MFEPEGFVDACRAALAQDTGGTRAVRELLRRTIAEPGSVLAGLGEVLEQHAPQAPTLLPVVDDEGHLGDVARIEAVVAGHADELVIEERDEGEPVEVLDASLKNLAVHQANLHDEPLTARRIQEHVLDVGRR